MQATWALPQLAFVVLLFVLFPMMRGRPVRLPFARRIGSLTYAFYLLHFQIGLMVIAKMGTASNRWYLLAALAVGLFAASLLIDDIIEFRLRWLWKRLIDGGVNVLAYWLAGGWRAKLGLVGAAESGSSDAESKVEGLRPVRGEC